MSRVAGWALGLVALAAVAVIGAAVLVAHRLAGPYSLDDELRRRKAELDRKRERARGRP